MTKEKLKWIIKRLPYILKMLRDRKNTISVYVSGGKEKIVIDSDILTVLEIMEEIIECEKSEWRKKLFIQLKNGRKDISILINSPMGRTKYYEAKKEFIDKIYQCCIFKGLVEYKDILNTKIGL